MRNVFSPCKWDTWGQAPFVPFFMPVGTLWDRHLLSHFSCPLNGILTDPRQPFDLPRRQAFLLQLPQRLIALFLSHLLQFRPAADPQAAADHRQRLCILIVFFRAVLQAHILVFLADEFPVCLVRPEPILHKSQVQRRLFPEKSLITAPPVLRRWTDPRLPWIVQDITEHRQQINVILHRLAQIPPLEQMPAPLVFSVVVPCIRYTVCLIRTPLTSPCSIENSGGS